MTISLVSRREFAVQSTAALGSLPRSLALEASGQPSVPQQSSLKVVCVGAHPDDPESGCGGTLARYAEAGHRVTIMYLTRGETGIRGKTQAETAAIRTAEAQAACKILGANPVFVGQINGSTEVNPQRTEEFSALLRAEQPDVLLTHWPIDTHPDHQVASLLSVRAYLAAAKRFALYFFEVNYGYQSMGFQPTEYVDITPVRDKKKAALFAHRSQDGEGIYRQHHEIMENFRGREAGVAAAEAFVALARNEVKRGLPGLA
jgi:LmbE family N-acetylglucosaminyl deacetylase